ncbi:MAG: hypothetical protein RBR21_07895 [Bacteroidales bacterium]|nr:hypothetical protein [Bacteroidales bacterium]
MIEARDRLATMNEVFTVDVWVKPYVKKYLENNFGTPVDLRTKEGSMFYDLLQLSLQRPLHSYTRGNQPNTFLTAKLKLVIDEDTFHRYGFDMNKRNMIRFNSFVEKHIKLQARIYIGFQRSLGVPVSVSIPKFQEKFGFTEDDFPYDTIKKDFDRNGDFINFDMLTQFKEDLSTLLLEQLSKIGHQKPINNEDQQALRQ